MVAADFRLRVSGRLREITAMKFEFEFTPVRVNGGRKFRGDGYALDERRQECYYGGYNISASGFIGGRWRNADRYTAVSHQVQVWDPETKTCCWVTAKFVQPREVAPEVVAADQELYAKSAVDSTLAWCRTKVSSEAEAIRFARNVIRKHHPELMAYADAAMRSSYDVVAEVESTLRWALSLPPCFKREDRQKQKVVSIAYRALEKKRVTEMDGFKEAWVMAVTLLELPDYGITLGA